MTAVPPPVPPEIVEHVVTLTFGESFVSRAGSWDVTCSCGWRACTPTKRRALGVRASHLGRVEATRIAAEDGGMTNDATAPPRAPIASDEETR